jgi:hypothetical protein
MEDLFEQARSNRKGRIVYAPEALIKQADTIVGEGRAGSRAQAFIEIVKYAEVGREAERIYRLDFKTKPLFKMFGGKR